MESLKKTVLALGVNGALTREQMRNVMGGSVPVACYQCCTQDREPQICGRCDTSGSGGCQGNGKAWPCFCA